MKSSLPQGGLSFWSSLRFALPIGPLMGLTVALAVHLPRHYASEVGLSLAATAASFILVRLIDFAVDPILGLVIDRTRTRFGRYRFWMAAAAPLLCLSVYMLFFAPRGAGSAYLAVWLMALYVGGGALMLAHMSWAALLAPRYHDRSRLFGLIQVVSALGTVALLVTPTLINAASQGRAVAGAVPLMGGFLLIAMPLCVAIATFWTPEPTVVEGNERLKLRDYVAMLVRPEMARVALADFCLGMGLGWMSALYLFFFQDILGFSEQQANILLFLFIAVGIIGAAAVGRVATICGKHQTLMGLCFLFAIGTIAVGLLPKGAFPFAAILMAVAGVASIGFNLLTRAMVADMSDAVRLDFDKSRAALLYSILTSTTKLSGAISIGVSFYVLSLIGYDPSAGAANTEAAINSLYWLFLAGPVACVALGGIVLIGYRLDANRHGAIIAALARRDASPGS